MRKLIITEQERNYIKSLYNLNKNLIIEASKIDVLTKKIGLDNSTAEKLDRLCGSLSVWMANKIIEDVKNMRSRVVNVGSGTYITQKEIDNDKFIKNVIYDMFIRPSFVSEIQGIMDYIRVSLNGNTSTIKNLPYREILSKSVQWHESLNSGKTKIDYKEKYPIILDYRDSKGFGYYWVDLETNQCPEESERMGHCGRSAGKLYSLREYIPAQNEHTLNRSLLTASIDQYGTLLQLKGPKNSKPLEQYYPYIIELFKTKDKDGDYLIKSIGSEYNNSNDFKLLDLNDNGFKSLYSLRPNLFNSRLNKERLYKLQLISKEEFGNDTIMVPFDKMEKICQISFSEDKWGIISEDQVFEILSDDDMFWDIWMEDEIFRYNKSIPYINKNNIEHIWQIMRTISNEDFDEYTDLENAIEEYDKNGFIKNTINKTYQNTLGISFKSNLEDQITNSLEEIYGPTTINDYGFEIKINFSDFLSKNRQRVDLDEIFSDCDDDYLCVLETLLDYNKHNKKRLYNIEYKLGVYSDGRVSPIVKVNINQCFLDLENNFDSAMFNRMLNDELNDL